MAQSPGFNPSLPVGDQSPQALHRDSLYALLVQMLRSGTVTLVDNTTNKTITFNGFDISTLSDGAAALTDKVPLLDDNGREITDTLSNIRTLLTNNLITGLNTGVVELADDFLFVDTSDSNTNKRQTIYALLEVFKKNILKGVTTGILNTIENLDSAAETSVAFSDEGATSNPNSTDPFFVMTEDNYQVALNMKTGHLHYRAEVSTWSDWSSFARDTTLSALTDISNAVDNVPVLINATTTGGIQRDALMVKTSYGGSTWYLAVYDQFHEVKKGTEAWARGVVSGEPVWGDPQYVPHPGAGMVDYTLADPDEIVINGASTEARYYYNTGVGVYKATRSTGTRYNSWSAVSSGIDVSTIVAGTLTSSDEIIAIKNSSVVKETVEDLSKIIDITELTEFSFTSYVYEDTDVSGTTGSVLWDETNNRLYYNPKTADATNIGLVFKSGFYVEIASGTKYVRGRISGSPVSTAAGSYVPLASDTVETSGTFADNDTTSITVDSKNPEWEDIAQSIGSSPSKQKFPSESAVKTYVDAHGTGLFGGTAFTGGIEGTDKFLIDDNGTIKPTDYADLLANLVGYTPIQLADRRHSDGLTNAVATDTKFDFDKVQNVDRIFLTYGPDGTMLNKLSNGDIYVIHNSDYSTLQMGKIIATPQHFTVNVRANVTPWITRGTLSGGVDYHVRILYSDLKISETEFLVPVVTFAVQSASDGNDISTNAWRDLHNIETVPIQAKDASEEYWTVAGSGVIYCSAGSLSAIGVEAKLLYSYASSQTGTFSTWADVATNFPGLGSAVAFRSKLAAGGSGNTQYRDYMPYLETTFKLGTACSAVSDDDWVKFKYQMRLPDTGFPTIDSRYGWSMKTTAYQKVKVLDFS